MLFFFVSLAIHHFRDILSQRTWDGAYFPHEYRLLWSDLNKKHICWLFQENLIDKNWYKNSSGKEHGKWDCSNVESVRPKWWK